MGELHPLAAFGVSDRPWPDAPPSYWYEGRCPHTQAPLRLPRTAQAEAIAQGLMAHLAADPHHPQEGKMYGVLLVTTPTGTPAVLQAFSGLLGGQSQRAGWVPPIPGRSQVALLERQTLQQLAALKADLLALAQLPERAALAQQSQHFAEQLAALATRHRARKQERDRQRAVYTATRHGEALDLALAALIRQSQQDGTERRQLKRERDQALEPLRAAIAQADQQIATLKQQRQALSKQLQTQLHAAYALTNFAGQTASLQALWPTGLPTGTGDCAAPKLLHYAATHDLKPVALAEFWWGPASRERQPGAFYGACAERCQPIMGFLLSGLTAAARPLVDLDQPLPIWYEDEALLVVNKPPGLLSVPGRTRDLQDSVLSRLRCQWPPEAYLAAPHRLDKGTSGLLLLAKTPAVHRALNAQFAQRQVQKTYEAILSRPIERDRGCIDLPLWRDPRDRPKTAVHPHRGKPSLTEFHTLASGPHPRLRFMPHTGRTHQLRVHAAHPQGLNAPLLGDTLYGAAPADRLYLHAQALQFVHPLTQQAVALTCPTPF